MPNCPVWSRMSQAAVLTACQTPLKSGLPSVERCAGAGSGANDNKTIAPMVEHRPVLISALDVIKAVRGIQTPGPRQRQRPANRSETVTISNLERIRFALSGPVVLGGRPAPESAVHQRG